MTQYMAGLLYVSPLLFFARVKSTELKCLIHRNSDILTLFMCFSS